MDPGVHAGLSRIDDVDLALRSPDRDDRSGYTQIAAALSVLVLGIIPASNLMVRRMTRGEVGF